MKSTEQIEYEQVLQAFADKLNEVVETAQINAEKMSIQLDSMKNLIKALQDDHKY